MDSQNKDEFKPKGRQQTLARRLGDALDDMDSRNSGACPDGEMLAAYAERGLGQVETEKWETHFAACSRCRKILHVLAVSTDTPLAEKEVARLGELISASHLVTEMPKRNERRGGPGVAGWRTRWLAPAIGAAAVLAVWFALRPPWRATERGSSDNLIAQAPKEELPISPPAQALDSLSKSAPKQDEDQAKMPSIPPADSPVKARAQNSLAEPTAKGGPEASSRLDNDNLSAAEDSKRSLQAEKKADTGVVRNESPAQASPRPSANQPQAAAGSAATPQAQADAVASPAAPTPARVASSANALGNSAARDRQAPAPQQSAGPLPAPALAPPSAMNERNFKSMMAMKTTAPATVQATAPYGSTVWRMGGAGKIERSGDSGETWTPQASASQEDWLAAVAISDTVCWVAGRNSAIARTTDGDHWVRIAPPALPRGADDKLPDWTGLTARDAQSATITASNGRKFSTADGGKTWQAQ